MADVTEWNSDGPTFPLEVSTDKYYYVQGEGIRITLLNVGDENITFYVPPDLYIVNVWGQLIVDTEWCPKLQWIVNIPPNSTYEGGWNQKYLICDMYGWDIPPTGDQVPQGRYLISAGMDIAGYGDEIMPIWDSVWIEIGPAPPSLSADAGSDHVVNEGDIVHFDGTGSSGPSPMGEWEDEFDDSSKIAHIEDVHVYSGRVELDNVSFSVLHTFDTDEGFILEDDAPETWFAWDPTLKAMKWHSYRGDPYDTWEKMVRDTPFNVTDRFNFQASVDYVYTRADSLSEVYPFIAMKKENRRITSKTGPADNSLPASLYGGNPNDDHHAVRMWDDTGVKKEPLNVVYIDRFNERLRFEIEYDSDTRMLTAQLLDRFGGLMGSGSSYMPSPFILSKYGVGSMADGGGGYSEGWADNISFSAFGYKSPGTVVSEVISAPEGFSNWGFLNLSSTEPWGTSVLVDVLDENGSVLVSGIRGSDCPFDLGAHFDNSQRNITLRATMDTSRVATPHLHSWNVSWFVPVNLSYFWDFNNYADGDGDGNFTNDVDATGPTPSWTYGDNGEFTVTLTVTDGLGNHDTDASNVTVLNIAPTISDVSYELSEVNVGILFRIAGEKWHNVEIHVFEDDVEIGYANITRYPGSPNDQMVALANITVDFSSNYSAVAYYTPEDDPINGRLWGANPAWLIIESEEEERRAHHTFNVRHEETWVWVVEDLKAYFPLPSVMVAAIGSDPGSDDLTFTWDWGDGTTTEQLHYNDGTGPDPYPSPEVNPITIAHVEEHEYPSAGFYTIVLTVTDDDGGVSTVSFTVSV